MSSCAADRGQLDLPSFRYLESQAVDSVDLSFGRFMISPASWFLSAKDPETRDLKALLRGVKSVRIRSYTFDRDFAYSQREIDSVRAQLVGKGWNRVLQSRNRDRAEDVDIYVAMDGDETLGFALIASEPREFTILNIVGAIDVTAVQRLRKQFESKKHEGKRSASRHPIQRDGSLGDEDADADADADVDADADEVANEEDLGETTARTRARTHSDHRRVVLAVGH
ncbi:MAG TPA: DUF4252 domain-containing protein, partial [Steroidobacteraceae bacterium]|nr:DUF4252 domain-containing protein [Steroidobacteraceae bacterium]